jgi:hypothetical protein
MSIVRSPLPPWTPRPGIAAYLAGFLDGDGSISINRGGSGRIEVRLDNTDKPTLEWIARQLPRPWPIQERGASKPHHKPMYNLTLWTWHAVQFLEAVLPYLIIKRQEADEALGYQNTVMSWKERRIYVRETRKGGK